MIVALAYACSKPDTVVIKSQYAVVTDMAVRSSRGSKYITSFTIFKLKKQVTKIKGENYHSLGLNSQFSSEDAYDYY
jgi:hypothetical protein